MSVGGAHDTVRQEPGTPQRPNRKWVVAVGGLVAVFVLLAGYDLVTSGNVLSGKPAASTSASPAHSVHAVADGGASPSGTGSPGRSAAPSPSPSAIGSPSATPAPVALTAVSVAAFGPDGTSDGDNPQYASRVLTGTQGWSSSWYDSAEFGNLQAGTGLLFDMGQQVSISSLRIQLGSAAGADVQVRLGDTPDMAALSETASASDAGGTVQIPLSAPTRARYVLIWFTLLPPDAAGTYQVTVYNVTVDGQP